MKLSVLLGLSLVVCAGASGVVATEGDERTFPLPNHPKITAYDLMDQALETVL